MAYGFLSNQAVTELIHRHAYTLEKGQLKPLSDNLIIEKLLGDKNILCLNDLVHEIYHVGENFDSCLRVLKPFKLAQPVGNFEKKILNVHDEVESHAGFIGDKIEEFIQKIV